MHKNTTKAAIVREGARLIHARGFNATGLSDILKAAGVPKGSFYFYFKSKEDFGLSVIDHNAQIIVAKALSYLGDSSHPPLQRLSNFMDGFVDIFEKMDLRRGCPIGNLIQEMSDSSEAIREKMGDVYALMAQAITQCLNDAKACGDISDDLDSSKTAQFILNSWEGSIMHMKLTRDSAPLVLCKQMIFDYILTKRCMSDGLSRPGRKIMHSSKSPLEFGSKKKKG